MACAELFGGTFRYRCGKARIAGKQQETVVGIEQIRHQNRVFIRVFATIAITSARSSPVQPGACLRRAAAVDRRASGGSATIVPETS